MRPVTASAMVAAGALLLAGAAACGSSAAPALQSCENALKVAINNGSTPSSPVAPSVRTACNGLPAASKAQANTFANAYYASTHPTASPTSPAPVSTTPASSPSPAATPDAADVQACTGVEKSYAAFQANENLVNEAAFAASLIEVDWGAMTPSLWAAFQALNTDVQNAELTGTAGATSQADEQAVANGCAAAGVTLPSGFTS